MADEEIQPEEAETPEAPPTMWDSGDWGIDSESLSLWLETDYGQVFRQKVESGEWNKKQAKKILQEMSEGRTYEDARDRLGWKGMPRRMADDLMEAIPEVKELTDDPSRVFTDPWKQADPTLRAKNQEEGIMGGLSRAEGKAGQWVEETTGSKSLAKAGILVWEIPKSFVVGIPMSIGNIAKGEGDLGDVLDVATLFIGVGRAARMNSQMGKFAGQLGHLTKNSPIRTSVQQQVQKRVQDAIVNNKKTIRIPKKMVRNMLNDHQYGPLLQAKLRQLQKAGKISKNIEIGVESLNLFVQNEELLLELMGYAGQRITTNAVERFNRGGINMEQAFENAVQDFASQFEQEQGWTPPEQDPAPQPAEDEDVSDPQPTEEEDTEDPQPTEEDAEEAEDTEEEVEEEEEDTGIEEEDTEGDVEPAEEEKQRITLEQAKELGDAFSDERIGEIDEPERVSIEQGVTSDTYSDYNIYQDLKHVGGIAHFQDPSGERILYYANDPKRTEQEAIDISKSDSVYSSADHQYGEFDVGEAYYPTFESVSDVITYMREKMDKEVGGVLEGSPLRKVWSSDRKAQYQVRYELRELDEVQSSHFPDGSENPQYSKELQPREQRGGTVSLEQVKEYSGNLNTDFLLDYFSTLSDGAPILSKKLPNNVLSGNARTMAMKQALQDHQNKTTEDQTQWEKYQEVLREKAASFGITPEQIESMTNPVLVQVLAEDVDEVALADDANKSSVLEGTSTEQANRDASYLKDDVMISWVGEIGQSLTDTLNSKANLEFRQKLLQNIPNKERSGFLSSDGDTISERGARRIRNMMMRYVFRGDYGIKLSEILIESKLDEIQNINNMLETVIPNLALLESYFRVNMRDAKYSIAEELARSVAMMDALSKNQESITMFLKQDVLIPPKTPISQLSVPSLQMLYIMDNRKGAYRQLSGVFLQYVDAVLELNPQQGQLFETKFSKREFFEHHIFNVLFDNPPEDLKNSLEAGSASQAREIVQSYTDSLMSEIERQAEQRGMEEEVQPDPEPQPTEEETEQDEETQEEDAEETDEETEQEEEAQQEEETQEEEDVTEDEETGITDEEYGVAKKDYEYNLKELTQLYFNDIWKEENYTEADKLPDKVEFSEQFLLSQNAPQGFQDAVNQLLELKRIMHAYETASENDALGPGEAEANLRKEVETAFGASMLDEYDKRVAQQAFKTLWHRETLKLINYKPGDKNDGFTSRTYAIGAKGETFITITHDPSVHQGYTVLFDIPNYEKKSVYVDKNSTFTDKQARAAINEAIDKAIDDKDFVYGDNPRTEVKAPHDKQQARIDKMPPIVEESAFKDAVIGTKEGLAFSMPGLDPAMRIKAKFTGDNSYDVYVESEMIENNANLHSERVFANSPLDAVQRVLADMFDDSVWDRLGEDPDPQPNPLDDQGVAGNMPSPLPDEIKISPIQRDDGLLLFEIVDESGNPIPDYSITVDADPLGLGDNVMDVSIRFPNHPDIDGILHQTQGATVEEAVIKAISELKAFEIGKGGLGSPSPAQHESSTDSQLENRPPPMKTTDKDFGKLRIDKISMQREKLSQSGNIKIYQFDTKGTPRVKVTKIGDKNNPEWFVEVQYPRYNAASYVSYAKSGQTAATEAIKKLEESDFEWKPLYKSGIISEIDNVQNAINRRQFATTPAIERRIRGIFTNLKRGVSVDLRGYKITSNKELAVLGQIFRHPGLERHITFYLNDKFEIVGHETTGFGVPGQTVNTRRMRINHHMKRLNAKYIMNMHNHPGGPAMFSDADKESAGRMLKRYPNQYLGQVVVNSGEYAESIVRNGRLRNRESIELSEADLGWDPHKTKEGFFRRNDSIRPGDPLYQYDINSETGKLLQMWEHIEGVALGSLPSGNAAKFAKYLQTEKNWTTIFFKGHYGEILDVVDYKDLHLLDPSVLWSFIEGESRSRGGMHVDVYIGEGDWYKTKADVSKSVWGHVLNATYRNAMKQDIGIQFAWFDGLSDKKDVHYEYGRSMLSIYDTKIAGDIPGRLNETVIDSDYGVETRLTEPSEALDAFVARLRKEIADGNLLTVNALAAYEEEIGNYENRGISPLINEFLEFVGNQHILSENITPNEASPTDAMTTGLLLSSLTTPAGVPSESQKEGNYIAARLGAITEKDRVLTIGDTKGDLATLAKTAGAASVDTITTDGWTRKMFEQLLPGVAQVHNIDPDNLAREWVGPRPTVILLTPLTESDQMLDEALKLLAPNGRLVYLDKDSNKLSRQFVTAGGTQVDVKNQRIDRYWNTLKKRNTIRHIDYGPSSRIMTIDKRKGSGSFDSVSQNDAHALYAKVEEHRHARAPIAEADIDAEFTGIGPGEQTFDQPISNPVLPGGMSVSGESLSLPSPDGRLGEEGESVASARPLSRPGMDVGVAQSELEGSDIATQDNVSTGMSPDQQGTQVGMDESVVGRSSIGSLEGGENVDTDMAGRPLNRGMSVQDGQATGQRSTRSAIESRSVVGPNGTRIATGGISNYETGITQRKSSIDIPVAVATETGAAEVPNDTPTTLSDKIRKYLTSTSGYSKLPQTGRRTLELMGDVGMALVTSLKRIRNFGDKQTGRGFSVLDSVFPRWKGYIRDYAKQNNQTIAEATKTLNGMLVQYHEGKSTQNVPDVVREIADKTRGFLQENLVTPMIEENLNILGKGYLFEMPGDFVDKGFLEEKHRAEIEMDRPQFDKFMRRSGQQWKSKGVIQGFVQDNETNKVYAVFVHQKADVPNSKIYTLEDPFGHQVKVDESVLLDQNTDYSLIASRDPYRQKWTGDRDVAKHLWDSEVSSGMPDELKEAFTNAGVTFPEGAKLIYSKIANIQQWEMRKDGREIYRLRRIVPPEEKVITTPYGSYTQYSTVHSAYNDFAGKLLVYKASEVRNPIFTYRGRLPYKIWTPLKNYYPHVIKWNDMSPNPADKDKYEKFVEYAQEVADANQVDVNFARDMLTKQIAEAKTRKYGHLEQDRQFIFPNYNRNYFQVLEQYMARAMHRVQTIKEFGQANDLLEAKLMEFLTDDDVMNEISDVERAVLRLRWYAGYRDFEKGGKGPQSSFRNDAGQPIGLNQHEGDFSSMRPDDWRLLVDGDILSVSDDGTYIPTEAGLMFLENPTFLQGVLAKGTERMNIASDIVTGQLGWRKADIFDETFSDMVRSMRSWVGFIYLGRAWAANIAQPVNAAIVTDPKSVIKGYIEFLGNSKHKEYAKEIGAVAIDVMHDYGGEASFGNRLLRQMLGATPHYQVGKLTPKSLSPFKKHLEDDGTRTLAWSPFFAVEKINRSVSALMGRAYAASQMKTMLRKPNRVKTARERILAQPGAYDLESKLDEALQIPNLTTKDIEIVQSLTEQEVRDQVPHLFPVYEFLAEYAKETADYTQHRVESMDRGKLWRDNPVVLLMQQLQSFNIAQTKYIKDTFKREWRIMHEFLKESQPIESLKNKNVARALGSLYLIPRILTWAGIYGYPAAMLGQIVRFRIPDEETLKFTTAVYKAGMMTAVGEYMRNIWHWSRGVEEAMLGPGLGIVADVIGDAVDASKQDDVGSALQRGFRTPLRLMRPPTAGPSAEQIIEWATGEDPTPVSPVNLRGGRNTGQRIRSNRTTIRR